MELKTSVSMVSTYMDIDMLFVKHIECQMMEQEEMSWDDGTESSLGKRERSNSSNGNADETFFTKLRHISKI